MNEEEGSNESEHGCSEIIFNNCCEMNTIPQPARKKTSFEPLYYSKNLFIIIITQRKSRRPGRGKK